MNKLTKKAYYYHVYLFSFINITKDRIGYNKIKIESNRMELNWVIHFARWRLYSDLSTFWLIIREGKFNAFCIPKSLKQMTFSTKIYGSLIKEHDDLSNFPFSIKLNI